MRADPTRRSSGTGLFMVAAMEANGNGASTSGQIVRTNRGFGVEVNGRQIAHKNRFDAAVEQLARGLRSALPPASRDWGVRIQCSTDGFAIAYGNLRRGGGGGGPALSACVQHALREFRGKTLESAIEHGAHVLRRCCGTNR